MDYICAYFHVNLLDKLSDYTVLLQTLVTMLNHFVFVSPEVFGMWSPSLTSGIPVLIVGNLFNQKIFM